MDGANMNAQVGLCRPGDIGADVCHLNLHKTFCIPHGGGGPGMGPIGVAAHLVPFLPGHADRKIWVVRKRVGAVSAAPWGSASILTISWMYIRMMGGGGLNRSDEDRDPECELHRQAARSSISRCSIKGTRRPRRARVHSRFAAVQERGIEVEDVAKRLMDYGFHAPTVSFPVAGHADDRADRERIERGTGSLLRRHDFDPRRDPGSGMRAARTRQNNLLKNAPHTAQEVTADEWDRPYSREQAAFPAPWTREHKFWPAVARIDNVYGDRNLFCSCVPIDGLPE